MASLFIVSADGKSTRSQIAVATNLGHLEYKMHSSEMLSWQEYYPFASYKLPEFRPHLISVGEAKIYMTIGVRDGACSALIVRIESPTVRDLERAIPLMLEYIGGKIVTFDLNPVAPNSFIGGVANDFRRLKEWLKRGIRVARQWIGFRIAA